MIPELRKEYNSKFSEGKYLNFLNALNSEFGFPVGFRVAETPIFIPEELVKELISAGDLILQYIQSEDFKSSSKTAIPDSYAVPNEDEHTKVLALDFAVCIDKQGHLIPKLIELQGFPSLYFFQAFLNNIYRECFHIPQDFTNYFSDYDQDSHNEALRDMIVGKCDPVNVILLEIEPDKQKTKVDFICTEKYIGVKPVCITEVLQEGKKLYYKRDGRKIQIQRIYNRVIFDELNKRTDLKLNFSFRDKLDVEWIGHPNWFYKISKHTLPFLKNRYVPNTKYLNDIETVPKDIENYVLKPLYSFAGSGVKYDVTKNDIDLIKNKQNYILQEKISYAPVIETPSEPAKAEVRLLYIWDKEPVLINNIVRLSKGSMMGVDFNKDKTWVGASIAYFRSNP